MTDAKYTLRSFAAHFTFPRDRAIDRAAELGYSLHSFTSPVEAAEDNISPARAKEIAADDIDLVYVIGPRLPRSSDR
jgi:hypothetical protein